MAYRDPEVQRQRDRERFRQRTAERRARGLCPRCGDRPPATDRTVCEPCADKRNRTGRARDARLRAEGKPRRDPEKARAAGRERDRRQRARRQAQGLCAKCGREPAAPARRLCERCAGKRREADRAHYEAARAEGKLYGGRDPDAKRRSARAGSRKRDNARRDAGLCTRCGRRPPIEGGKTCGPCRVARQAAERERYAARRAAGLCVRCGGLSSTATRAVVRAPCSTRNAATGRRRMLPPAGVTPNGARRGAVPTAASPRRGPAGAMRVPAAPTSTRTTSAACRSGHPASRCSCARPTNASPPSTTRWRPSPSSPSRSSTGTGSRSWPTAPLWQPWPGGSEPTPGVGAHRLVVPPLGRRSGRGRGKRVSGERPAGEGEGLRRCRAQQPHRRPRPCSSIQTSTP